MTSELDNEESPSYAASPETVSDARRFVRTTLEGWGVVDLDDAALLTSELATNAVVHARSVYTVRIDMFDGRVRIGVIDRSPAEARRRHYSPMSGTGRGLALVAELATAWGVEPAECGKCVWFELPLDQRGATAAAIAAAVEASVAGEVDIDELLRELEGEDGRLDAPER